MAWPAHFTAIAASRCYRFCRDKGAEQSKLLFLPPMLLLFKQTVIKLKICY